MKNIVYILSALVLVFTILNSPKANAQSLAEKLASIEAGYHVDSDHKYVKRFESLLSQLDQKYKENEQQISDITVKGWQILKNDKGIEESLIKIMEGLNLLFTGNVPVNYRDACTSYVILRDKGYNHQRAIDDLGSVLDALDN